MAVHVWVEKVTGVFVNSTVLVASTECGDRKAILEMKILWMWGRRLRTRVPCTRDAKVTNMSGLEGVYGFPRVS